MKRSMRVALLLIVAVAAAAQYYPPPGSAWQKRGADKAGFDRMKLQAALAFALQSESAWDFAKDQQRTFGKPLGPVPEKRAATNLMVLKDGYILAEIGDTLQPDPMYSAAKSFLSMTAGLAFDRHLFRDAGDPVGLTVKDGGYASARNAQVTWRQHLQQTSEWEGEMWGKKHDFVGKEAFGGGERKPRDLEAPGSHYEYNDVRVNRLSLSLLRLFERPLPEVFKELVMDPIGASDTWRWHGYDNSLVEIGGRKVASVPGGTRWGGGLWMSTRDMARVGLLVMNQGNWNGRQLISERWLKESVVESGTGPDYGYLWWLNTKGKQWPSAPKGSFAAVGNGSNIIWIDREHKLVVVWRWYQGAALDVFLGKLLGALKK